MTVLFVLASFSPAGAQSPFSGFNPAILADRPSIAFIDGRLITGSDALALKAIYLDEWDGPFDPDGKNFSDLYWNTSAGAAFGGWRLAGFYRGEATIEANGDTVTLLRSLNLKKIDSTGKFDIDMGITGFSATGIELSKGFGLERLLKGLDAGITARYLNGRQVQQGTLTGTAATTGLMTYDFDLVLDYFYDRNLVYSRPDAIAGTGEGYSFDLGFRYVHSQSLKAELLFRDLLGSIQWKAVPYTKAHAVSDVISFDEQGFQQYSPTISGFEVYKDFTQKIQRKTDLSLSYSTGPFMIRPEVNFIGGRSIKWIFTGVEAWSALFVAGYNFDYHGLSLGIEHRNFCLQAFTDDLDLKNANALGLSFAAAYVF